MGGTDVAFGYSPQCFPVLADISSLSALGPRQLAAIQAPISARHLSSSGWKCRAGMRGDISRHDRGMVAQAWHGAQCP